MSLPRELVPDPLIISTIELRFKSQKDPSTLLSIVYPEFSSILPNLSAGKRTENDDADDSSYLSEHILSNDSFLMAFGRNVLSFENIGKYPLWSNYFEFVSQQLQKFLRLGIIEEVQRIGVRYASLLENVFEPEKVFKSVPLLDVEGAKQELSTIQTILRDEEFIIHLQVFTKAMVQKTDRRAAGIVIDIDASYEETIHAPNDGIVNIIDELHTKEKNLFFKLLKPEFINELNPTY